MIIINEQVVNFKVSFRVFNNVTPHELRSPTKIYAFYYIKAIQPSSLPPRAREEPKKISRAGEAALISFIYFKIKKTAILLACNRHIRM